MAPNRPAIYDICHDLYCSPANLSPYSVPLPGTEHEGCSPIYRHWKYTDKLLDTVDPNIRTAHDFFDTTAKICPKNHCLGHRPWNSKTKSYDDYVWQDYETVSQRRNNVGSALPLIHKQAEVAHEKRGIGLWCLNRPEWQIIDLACMSQSYFSVSIYDTLGPETTQYVIDHADLSCVCASLNRVPALINIKLTNNLPNFKIIICLDTLDTPDQPGQTMRDLLSPFAKRAGLTLYSLDEIEALGAANPLPHNPPTPDDIITINYTSGTTGFPKGVVHKHAAAVAATSSSLLTVQHSNDDVLLSFLPLAHIFQRILEHAMLWAGAAIAYYHGNTNEILEDLKLVRPTSFAGVPRLYTRLGLAIKAATINAPGFRGKLSNYVVKTKLQAINRPESGIDGTPTNSNPLWDFLWGRKVASAIGLDRCRNMITGSSPIDPELLQFIRIVFAASFMQGYGLTETYACSIIQLDSDLTAGTCGGLAPSTEAIIRDVPDMGYTSKDRPNPRGELWLRGTSIMLRYHKNPEETEKAIDKDGWFRTGDICEIDERGRFKIIDRVKALLKLSQGEYISPEKIESILLGKCSWLSNAMVHGDSSESCLVGIMGIDPQGFAQWASNVLGSTISPNDTATLEKVCREPVILHKALLELQQICRESKLNKYEECKAIRLYMDPFTTENELLTPTFKLRRTKAAQVFKQDIADMYRDISQSQSNVAFKYPSKL